MAVSFKPFRRATVEETNRFEYLVRHDRGFQVVVFPACPKSVPDKNQEMCVGLYGDHPIAFKEVVSEVPGRLRSFGVRWMGQLAVYLQHPPLFCEPIKNNTTGQLLTFRFPEGSATHALSSLAFADVTRDGVTDLVFRDGFGNLYVAETERTGPLEVESSSGEFETVVGDIIKDSKRGI